VAADAFSLFLPPPPADDDKRQAEADQKRRIRRAIRRAWAATEVDSRLEEVLAPSTVTLLATALARGGGDRPFPDQPWLRARGRMRRRLEQLRSGARAGAATEVAGADAKQRPLRAGLGCVSCAG
jgi:hypothetical protein